jgi:hypothetical protein
MRATIPAPPRQPHRHGLFSVASVADVTDPHELLGVQWEPLPCEPPALWIDDCLPQNHPTTPDNGEGEGEGEGGEDTTPVSEKTPAVQPEPAVADPITVYGSWYCQKLGYTLDEIQQRARAHLLAGEQQAVERAVWTGDGGNRPYLASPDTVDLGEAECPAQLLATLYEYADTVFTGEPVIHAPRPVVPWLTDHITRESGRLVTTQGVPIAAGAGYTEANTGPGGIPAPNGSYWVYITGPVTVRRGPVEDVPNPTAAGFNRRDNKLLALAERRYLVGWDSCLTAALLFTPSCCC